MRSTKSTKRLLFLALFTVVGYVTLQVPFTKLAGANVKFSLFDFFAPIAGAFIGSWLGMLSILTVQLANIAVHQTPLTTASLIRLFPTLFAVYYFAVYSKKQSRNKKYILFVPLVAMLAFVVHPIGRTVWYYSLFWLIPLVAFLRRDLLLARSLGATFTAHAVGGAAWIWAFNLPATVWHNLIPIVIRERLLFALGIAASYLVVKHVLAFFIAKKLLPRLETVTPSL